VQISEHSTGHLHGGGMTYGEYNILEGDCREVLATLPEQHFHCCVTSPPYFGLRNYGHADQIGLEPTPDDFVAAMVAVFGEVWRVLRDDGVLWLNLGDSYTGNASSGGRGKSVDYCERKLPDKITPGLKPKDLIGIPWRVAFALQAEGWYLRDAVVWHKPAPMPGSQRDRCTSSYEFIFQLTKGQWSCGATPAPMSEKDAAWLAALIDGEGTISISRAKRNGSRDVFSARITIPNTCKALVDRARDLCGFGNVTEQAIKPPSKKQGYRWQIGNRRAVSVLLAVLPHLIAKREQALVALSCQSFNSYRGGGKAGPSDTGPRYKESDYQYKVRCWETIKQLNQCANPDLSWVKPHKARRPLGCKYFFDLEAVKEPWSDSRMGASGVDRDKYSIPSGRNGDTGLGSPPPYAGRTPRNVWKIAHEGFNEAHFATYPRELPTRCIKASTSEKGCCPLCGAPWERITDRDRKPTRPGKANVSDDTGKANRDEQRHVTETRTIGWQKTCDHNESPSPCRVLDPFNGAGTTGLAACLLGRDYTGIELNPEYAAMARNRIARELRPSTTITNKAVDSPLFGVTP
jgi:DNA modification methylase